MHLQERFLQLMKKSSDTLSLTYNEFCHIRNVLTRAELENLLFSEKLHTEVAQGKLCFTCRKVHFNLLSFTFGIQCNVCKQKVCRNCITQTVLPKEGLDDVPIQAFTPLKSTRSLSNPERCHSFDTQSPITSKTNDELTDLNYNDDHSHGCSMPDNRRQQSNTIKCPTEPTEICTDCFFLLQQIREKSRQRHLSPTISRNSFSSRSSSFNPPYRSISHPTSNYNLSSPVSSIIALLTQQQYPLKIELDST